MTTPDVAVSDFFANLNRQSDQERANALVRVQGIVEELLTNDPNFRCLNEAGNQISAPLRNRIAALCSECHISDHEVVALVKEKQLKHQASGTILQKD
jgi:hypothetical protein